MKTLETNLNPKTLSKNPNEFKMFLIALNCMENYIIQNKVQIDTLNKDYSTMDQNLLNKVPYNYKTRIKRLEEAFNLNQIFLTEISKKYKPDSSFTKNISSQEINEAANKEYTSLNWSVFMYIARDWTAEGKKEREENYTPIIDMVKKFLVKGSNILIPGAAQLRLGYELAKLGYNIDANDYNYLNVIICDYLFNYSKKNQFCYQPLIRSFSNYLSEDDVFKKYNFPDEDINLEGKGKIKMCCGDFTIIYKNKKNYYDCVITCFFIDTAKNVFEYIDIIEKTLKNGGIWINFGPLSYHWIGYDDIPSIELPYDKLKEVIQNFGFTFIHEDKSKTINYCEIENYMKNEAFGCIFFTAVKNKNSKCGIC